VLPGRERVRQAACKSRVCSLGLKERLNNSNKSHSLPAKKIRRMRACWKPQCRSGVRKACLAIPDSGLCALCVPTGWAPLVRAWAGAGRQQPPSTPPARGKGTEGCRQAPGQPAPAPHRVLPGCTARPPAQRSQQRRPLTPTATSPRAPSWHSTG